MGLCAFWLLPLQIYLKVYCIITVAFFYLSTHHESFIKWPIVIKQASNTWSFLFLSVYICFLVHAGLAVWVSHLVLVLEFNMSLLCYSMIILFSLTVVCVSWPCCRGVFQRLGHPERFRDEGKAARSKVQRHLSSDAEHCCPQTGWKAHLPPHRT